MVDLSRDEQLRRFEALIHASPDFIAIASMDQRVEFVNAAGRKLIGMPDDVDVAQTRIGDYLTPEAARLSEDVEQPAVMRDGHWSGTSELRDWRGGPPIPVGISSFLITDLATGEPMALATVQRDLRARLQAERMVAEAHSALRENEERQKALLLHMSDLLVLIGPDGVIKSASPSAAPSLGYEYGEKLGSSIYQLIHPDDVERVADRFAQIAARPGLSPALDVRLRAADGSWRRYEIIANNLVAEPALGGIVVAARDVTARYLAERALESQARILELITKGASLSEVLGAVAEEVEAQVPDTLCSVLLVEDVGDGRVLRHVAAPSMPDAYGKAVDGLPVDVVSSPCSLAASTSRPVLVADLLEADEWGAFHDLAAVCGVRACWSVPVRSPATDETLGTFALYQATSGLPGPEILELVDRTSHLIGIAVDRARFEGRLAHQATHDELTSLPNRTLLLDRLDTALLRHDRDPAVIPVVVFVDIDRLKVVNDSLGHDVGDALLVDIAQRLQARMRASDTIARFGGDEFVIVADEGDDVGAPIALVERILATISEPVELAGRRITPTASAGVVIATAYTSSTAVIRDADVAMYRAKHRGGSGYELFDSSMRERAMQRLDMEAQIRRGIVEGQFRVLYQPMIDLVNHAVVGFEALVRWAHPERGLLAPGAFIDLAEETGLIVDLGEWVLAEAARTVAEWGVKEAEAPLMLSVNVSSRQLASPTLVAAVSAARDAVDPWLLCIELTESTLMDNTPASRSVIDQLTSDGVCLSIDDFGTGYSSLSYLTRLPVTTLKIDQTFVAALGHIAEAETVAAAVISLGAQLGLRVVAEGVETAEQERVLLTLGCRTAQGFLFHRPLPANEARALLGP